MVGLFIIALVLPVVCSCQGLEGLRLVGSSYNHTGRAEVQYNDTWGAVCGSQLPSQTAKAVCRNLGFPWAVCAVPYTQPFVLGRRPDNATVWINNVNCAGDETSLDMCSFDGYGGKICTGSPIQVVCQSFSAVQRPVNISQIDASSTTVTVEWMVPEIPIDTRFIRHRVYVFEQTANTFMKQFVTRQVRYSVNLDRKFSVVIHSLVKNTTYKIQIRTEVKGLCVHLRGNSGFLVGRQSLVQVKTAEERKTPKLPLRLIPPAPRIDFMGRVEVFYNNSWGTVCDDAFGSPEANVICQSLNFSSALCHVREAGFGQGSGPIWMDNVDCSRGHEILKDCDFNGWGVHNCQHNADIGVICLKEENKAPVTRLSVDQFGATSITVSWKMYPFPPDVVEPEFIVFFSTRGHSTRVTVPGTETMATATQLLFDSTYRIQVRAEYKYQYCTNKVIGKISLAVRATTIETAPTAPPTAFHVLALNSTALEFQWGFPLLEYRNGVIKGYKLFLRPADNEEIEVIVDSNVTTEYIFVGLTPSTGYTCSVLAFTNDNGPRSVYLTVITPREDFVPIITGFGLNGDGFDRATVWPNNSDIRVHCDTHGVNAVVTWYKSDGAPVGTMDQNLRQVSYDDDGTNVLQIASNRLVSYCDAGVFSCEVQNRQGQTQRRTFTLLFTDVPPRPGSPTALRVTKSAVVLAWDEHPCDGGHRISGFTIRYRNTYQEYLTTTNMYVYNVNPSLRNYTVVGLEPYTSYNFSVQAISDEYLPSEFSLENIITTTAEGPSPPRFLEVVNPAPNIVEVRWTEPAEPNGIIISYTVYAVQQPDIILDEGPLTEPMDPIVKIFSGSTGAANITVPLASVYYVVTVTATVLNGGDEIEGESSEGKLIYVPDPAIPIIRNLLVRSSTNSSITLSWDYPTSTDEPILGFQVTYHASIEWLSKEGYLVRTVESMKQVFPYNVAKLTALTPFTHYIIGVSVLTSRGAGTVVAIIADTLPTTEERLAFFQLMLGPVNSCTGWQVDASRHLQSLHVSILSVLNNIVCPSCTLSDNNIRNEEISCRGVPNDQQIIYRARIVGTEKYSASHLVALVSDWVQTRKASILVDSLRFHVDPRCATALDSLLAPDCFIVETVTSIPVETTTSARPTPLTDVLTGGEITFTVTSIPVETITSARPTPQTDLLTGGEIGGLIIGCIIAILLSVFIVLLVIVLVRYFTSGFRDKRLVEEDVPGLTVSTICLDNPVYDSDSKPKDN